MDKYCTVLHWEEYYITVQSQNMCWSISEWNWIETSHSHVTNCQISVFFSYNLYILIIMLLCLIQLMTKPSGPLFWLRPTTWCQPQPQVIPHIYSQHSCFVSYLLLNWNVLLFNVRSAEVKPFLVVNYSQFRCVLIQKAKKKCTKTLRQRVSLVEISITCFATQLNPGSETLRVFVCLSPAVWICSQ